MRYPLVSIIIPCYNAERFLAEAIESALSQTYPNCEVIVVDDGSTDRSLACAESFRDGIHLESRANQGGCAARNSGFDLSRGEFIKFLDADDLMARDIIEKQVAALLDRPGCLAYGPWSWLKMNGAVSEVVSSQQQIEPAADLLSQWLSDRYCASHSLLWSRRALLKVGPWDETLTANQDGDMFLRALMAGVECIYVPEGVAYYRVVDGVTTSVGSCRTADSLASRVRVLRKLEVSLKELNQLPDYACRLGAAYCYLARVYAIVDSRKSEECFRTGLTLTDGYIPGTLLHRAAARIFGLGKKESLAKKLHAWRSALRIGE
jgi:glycosyltransferase involved in cell wall biosynthesis